MSARKGLGIVAVFALGVAGGAALFRAAPEPPAVAPLEVEAPRPPAPWRVRRVIDGDTFEVEGPGRVRLRVRLRRKNAPELDEPGGLEAKAALEARIGGKRVRIRAYARDRYGRTIAEIVDP